MNQDNTFHFFIPLEAVFKSEDTSKPVEERDRKVKGLASTPDLDLQGEKVFTAGIDTSYLIKYGVLNSDHSNDPDKIVGQVDKCNITKAGLFIEGTLLKGQPEADKWWTLINSLETSNSSRKPGLSIEGKIIRRENNVIKSCLLTAVALTMRPVNVHTWLEVVKSLSAEKFCSQPWIEKACTCCASHGPVSCDTKDPDDHKDACMCKTPQKALTAGGMGRPMIPQSLEGSAKITTIHKSFTFEDSINYLISERKYSPATAKAVALAIFANPKKEI